MQKNQERGLQVCPTRIDGSPGLVTHKITRGVCQDRQRGRYHKCFTCSYNNAFVAVHGLPEPPVPEVAETELTFVPDVDVEPVEAPTPQPAPVG